MSHGRALAALFAALALLPLVAPNDYVLGLGSNLLLNLGLVASLNLLMGLCGQISLAHAGFFGLGAYASGILSARYGFGAGVGVPAAILVPALAASAIGVPALRLHGHALAMATLGFNVILSVLFNELVGLTGGPNGLLGVRPFTLLGWQATSGGASFALAWLYGLGVLAVCLNLFASRSGRAMRALASSELAASSLGVDVGATKLGVFVLTAGMAGLAGCLYVHFNQYASPETFSFGRSLLLVVAVAIGGWGRPWGPVPGALVLTLLPEALGPFQESETVLLGAGMVAVLVAYPGGLAGLGAAMRARLR